MIDMVKKACKQVAAVVETRSEAWEASEAVSDISHEEMQMTSSPNSSVEEIHLQTSSMTMMDSVTSLAEDVADRDNNNSNNSNNINNSSQTASREDETHSVAVSEEVSLTTSTMISEVGSEALAEACSVEVP